jgi:hypothetical protein
MAAGAPRARWARGGGGRTEQGATAARQGHAAHRAAPRTGPSHARRGGSPGLREREGEGGRPRRAKEGEGGGGGEGKESSPRREGRGRQWDGGRARADGGGR